MDKTGRWIWTIITILVYIFWLIHNFLDLLKPGVVYNLTSTSILPVFCRWLLPCCLGYKRWNRRYRLRQCLLCTREYLTHTDTYKQMDRKVFVLCDDGTKQYKDIRIFIQSFNSCENMALANGLSFRLYRSHKTFTRDLLTMNSKLLSGNII